MDFEDLTSKNAF